MPRRRSEWRRKEKEEGKWKEEGKSGMKEEKGGKKWVQEDKKGKKTESGVLSFKLQRKHGGIYLIPVLRILIARLPLLKKILGY